VLSKRRVLAAPVVVLIAILVGVALAYIGYTYKFGFKLSA
jgi:hypothetical protein